MRSPLSSAKLVAAFCFTTFGSKMVYNVFAKNNIKKALHRQRNGKNQKCIAFWVACVSSFKLTQWHRGWSCQGQLNESFSSIRFQKEILQIFFAHKNLSLKMVMSFHPSLFILLLLIIINESKGRKKGERQQKWKRQLRPSLPFHTWVVHVRM